jgi:hypothetical protein
VPLDKGEVLLVEEDRLRNLVLEYNQEITEKSRGFQNRWDAAVKETIQNPGIPPAELGVAEEWREAKRNLLLDKIYGQKQKETNAPSLGLIGLSGESSESTKSGKGKSETSGTPFFFTGIDTEASGVFSSLPALRTNNVIGLSGKDFFLGKQSKLVREIEFILTIAMMEVWLTYFLTQRTNLSSEC